MRDSRDWVFCDDFLPPIYGDYLVLWSMPFSDRPAIAKGYFTRTGWLGSPAGANEIIAWKKLPELPDLPRTGLRTRLVRL